MNGLSEKLREFLIKEPLVLEQICNDIEDLNKKYADGINIQNDILTEVKLLRQSETFQTERIKEQGKSMKKSIEWNRKLLWKILSWVFAIAMTVGVGVGLPI